MVECLKMTATADGNHYLCPTHSLFFSIRETSNSFSAQDGLAIKVDRAHKSPA